MTRKLLLALLLLAVFTGCDAENHLKKAPDFTLGLLEDSSNKVTLSEMVRDQPVLLVFWATWCPSCRNEIPLLNAWHQKYEQHGDFQILAVNVQESREHVLKFKESNPFSYSSVMDEFGDVSALYGLSGVPVSVFLAKGGEIIYYGFGLPPNVEQLLTRA